METENLQLLSTVLVETVTLGILSLMAISPMGMFIWLAMHPERFPDAIEPEHTIKHHSRHSHHHKAHPAH